MDIYEHQVDSVEIQRSETRYGPTECECVTVIIRCTDYAGYEAQSNLRLFSQPRGTIVITIEESKPEITQEEAGELMAAMGIKEEKEAGKSW